MNLLLMGVEMIKLETTRTSITRLKRIASLIVVRKRILETTRTSITRLKLIWVFIYNCILHFLKRQEPRLRDWNSSNSMFLDMVSVSWNDKNLDYEIETTLWATCSTRLFPWNDKNLDYEIETPPVGVAGGVVAFVTWNDKNLDYEIETNTKSSGLLHDRICLKRQEPRLRDWNKYIGGVAGNAPFCLKRQEPRLRDWNMLQRQPQR